MVIVSHLHEIMNITRITNLRAGAILVNLTQLLNFQLLHIEFIPIAVRFRIAPHFYVVQLCISTA
jgi:hypothetical protein